MGDEMKNIFSSARKTATELLNRGMNAADEWIYNHKKFTDTRQVHGFYKLVTLDGRFLEYRHNCPVSGDGRVKPPIKGAVAIHCIDRRRDVFDPAAPMPTVIRYPRLPQGSVRLSDGSVVVRTDAQEWDGEFEYKPSDPAGGR
jgi:hypothetical protein